MQVGGGTNAPRARAAISCTECHKRRKRCSEGQPCRNCARRYPPVECVYKPHPKRRQNAPNSVPNAESGQATSPSHTQQSQGTEDAEALSSNPIHTGELALDGNAASSKPGSRLPFRRQSSPVESQIPACSLKDKIPSIAKAGISSSDVLELVSQYGDQPKLPPAFGGGILDVLPSLQVAPTTSNAELFNIYTKILVPWLWTVDGNATEAPPGSWQSWIPLSIFSPMILYTNLYRAATWREMVRPTAFSLEVNSKAIAAVSPDCIALRGKSLSLLRNHLSSSSLAASSDEALCSVACIFFNEWSWSLENPIRDALPHVKVLCAMLKIRGGMSKLDFHAKGLLMIIHYQTAVILEREPWVFPPALIQDRFIPDYFPVKRIFDSPLFMSNSSFTEKGSQVGLHAITAQMLDNMTLILNDVRSVIFDKSSKIEREKILQTAIKVQDRVLSLRSANETNHPNAKDYIYEACRLATVIYLRAIINHTQISKAWHPEELPEMFSALTLTPMHYWKPLSGIWLFVLLSINPPRDDLYPGAMFKFFLKTSCFHMASWDWQCWVNIMETFLALQKWIREPVAAQVPETWSPRTTSDLLDADDVESTFNVRPS